MQYDKAYFSTCCKVQASKKPLKRIPNWRDAQPDEFGGLHGWRCGQCRKPCKVTVRKATDE